jgi:hypothetical protein
MISLLSSATLYMHLPTTTRPCFRKSLLCIYLHLFILPPRTVLFEDEATEWAPWKCLIVVVSVNEDGGETEDSGEAKRRQ